MNNVMHKSLSMYLFLFITLYMFRAHRAHHQERQSVSIQPLVTVILCWWLCRVYWYNLSLLMMSTMCSKHVENCVQEKSSRYGWFETTYHWSSWAYNTSHADKHVARAWISFTYLSSYNRCPHWSVWTCIKIFLGYSVHCWKHKFHKVFRY